MTGTNGPLVPSVTVRLPGPDDGNTLAVIGRVYSSLKWEGKKQEASDYLAAALECASYDELLALTSRTVNTH